MNGIMFGEIVETLDVPILNIGNRVGHTGYIDFILEKEVQYPIMKGKDCFGRSFIVLKLNGVIGNNNDIDNIYNDNDIDNENDNDNDNDNHETTFFQTFFQRYTDNKYLWMGACNNTDKMFFDTLGGMTNDHFELITSFIQNNDNIIYNTKNLYRMDSKILKYIVPNSKIPKIKSAMID